MNRLKSNRVPSPRKLLDGTIVTVFEQPRAVSLHTRAPGKWAAVDMETGEIWVRGAGGYDWTPASPEALSCVKTAVQRAKHSAASEQPAKQLAQPARP